MLFVIRAFVAKGRAPSTGGPAASGTDPSAAPVLGLAAAPAVADRVVTQDALSAKKARSG